MKHEEKICPRCNTVFECKVGSVNACQCSQLKLNDVEKKYIAQCFQDCLCAECIVEVRGEFHNKKLKEEMDKVLKR